MFDMWPHGVVLMSELEPFDFEDREGSATRAKIVAPRSMQQPRPWTSPSLHRWGQWIVLMLMITLASK